VNVQQRLFDYVEHNRGRLIGLIEDLVRRPSENKAPRGNEAECQRYVASLLKQAGWEPDVYELDTLPGLRDHPLFAPGRDYTDRANVAARRPGAGGGRSLILSGHVDTVPRGTQPRRSMATGCTGADRTT
jgi:acetylornithine deacetylase